MFSIDLHLPLSPTFTILLLLGVAGCTQDPGAGLYDQAYRLTCESAGVTRTFCIVEGKLCKVPTSPQACSWNIYNDLDHTENFQYTNIAYEDCAPEWEEGRFPPVENSTCGGAGGGSGGGGDTGSPTGGPEPTGGSEDSTGGSTGGSGKDVYLCALNVPTKCADLLPDDILAGFGGTYKDPYIDPNIPDDTEKDACWGAINVNAPPENILAPCVEAETANQARSICDSLCNTYQDDIDLKVEAICGMNNPNCKVVTEVDCAMDGQVGAPPAADSQDAPAKLSENPGWACDGPVMVPAWEGTSEFRLFEGSATLVTADGVTIGTNSLTGFVGYTLPSCAAAATECQIDFDALQLLTREITGGYMDATGDGGKYALERAGLQALNSFSGTWYKSRGTIVFPTAVIEAQIWGGTASLNEDPIPGEFGVSVVEVDQIVGDLASAGGPLILNLSYQVPEGTATLSLQTQ